MAIGKSKKQGRKGGKKKTVDPLSRKEWYDFKAPVPFNPQSFGKTLVTKSSGTRIASDQIKGRVVEASLADLNEKCDNQSWRKIKLIIDDVEGRFAKTSFYGMDITRDKLCQMIKKQQSLIDIFVNVKSFDQYIMRIFLIGFTKKHRLQKKRTAYAKHSHVKAIRKKATEIFTSEIGKMKINECVSKLATADYFTDKITKECKFIYPLQNLTIKKVKVLKRPNIDAAKLNEMYSHEAKGAPRGKGQKVEEEEDEKNLLKK